jgi:hypothetical protein
MIDFYNAKYRLKERAAKLSQRMPSDDAEALACEVITKKEQDYWKLKTEWCEAKGIKEDAVFRDKRKREAWRVFLRNHRISNHPRTRRCLVRGARKRRFAQLSPLKKLRNRG